MQRHRHRHRRRGGEHRKRSLAVLILAFGLAAGCFTVAWSAALLDFFLRYCNAPRGPITTELGRSAYAVYVIHPLIVVPLVAAYLAILRGPWETEVDFPQRRRSPRRGPRASRVLDTSPP